MKKIFFTTALLLCIVCKFSYAQYEYNTSVLFPSNYQVGDFVEFLQVGSSDAGAAGYYEVSISYTRGGIAAASTHLASITHSNPTLWREIGKINGNPYVSANTYNFTVDCNTQYGSPRFRIRAVSTQGSVAPIAVNIHVRSINNNTAWTAINVTGNDVSVNKFLAMTNEWSLYVGNNFTSNGAILALKAIENGNVGIGTTTPDAKLTVNGTIHSKEVIVDNSILPDYVFEPNYKLLSLKQVKAYIDENHHLPEVPSAQEVAKDGLKLVEMNNILLKKVEELTLYLIEQNNRINKLESQLSSKK